MLTCKVSIYCLLALQNSVTVECQKHENLFPGQDCQKQKGQPGPKKQKLVYVTSQGSTYVLFTHLIRFGGL